ADRVGLNFIPNHCWNILSSICRPCQASTIINDSHTSSVFTKNQFPLKDLNNIIFNKRFFVHLSIADYCESECSNIVTKNSRHSQFTLRWNNHNVFSPPDYSARLSAYFFILFTFRFTINSSHATSIFSISGVMALTCCLSTRAETRLLSPALKSVSQFKIRITDPQWDYLSTIVKSIDASSFNKFVKLAVRAENLKATLDVVSSELDAAVEQNKIEFKSLFRPIEYQKALDKQQYR
ncbi:hypothetical protein L9F63_022446, partial [Diploptera punctata]